jgi:hypothetical protein
MQVKAEAIGIGSDGMPGFAGYSNDHFQGREESAVGQLSDRPDKSDCVQVRRQQRTLP